MNKVQNNNNHQTNMLVQDPQIHLIVEYEGKDELARSCLLLLENDCIDRNCNTNAEGGEHSKGHFQSLMLHPIQVVHVFRMHIIRFVMAMSTSHPLHASRMETSAHCENIILSYTVGIVKCENYFTQDYNSKRLWSNYCQLRFPYILLNFNIRLRKPKPKSKTL